LINEKVFSYTSGAASSGSGFSDAIFCEVEQPTAKKKNKMPVNRVKMLMFKSLDAKLTNTSDKVYYLCNI
jgi:hypothetical protein